MERNNKYEKILIIIIVLILIVTTVLIILVVSGRLTLNINSPNTTTSNTIDNTNNQSNINDPYAKYPDMKWSTNIKYDENWCKVLIDVNLDLTMQLFDWNTETNNYDIPGAITVKKLPNNEKVKYFECVPSPQAPVMEYIIVLTTNNNLYYVGVDGSNKIFKLNSNNKAIELTRNIDTSPQIQYTRNDVYVLLDNGSLVKVNDLYNSDTKEITAELGLTYEERNSHKTTLVVGPYEYGYYITNENYIKNEDLTRSYILDENNSKFVLQYYFQYYSYGDCYFVSKTNKLYKLDSSINNKIELVNSKIISSIGLNGTTINIKYVDNTTATYELISTSSYQDKINLYENEAYDFSNKSDREIYAGKYLFKQF
ncbi:MAG: hypothetical protein PHD15_04645 [Clostridia bacterium]|nr:hypothetical protein [Clostridia bacterium]MDD4387029.1 hypothetical protein [Clostridia bacterium]